MLYAYYAVVQLTPDRLARLDLDQKRPSLPVICNDEAGCPSKVSSAVIKP